MTILERRAAAIMFNAVLLALSWVAPCRADDSDPPGRVARLGWVQGQVSIEPAGLDDWAAADVNRPVTRGDKLWADADSRAELSIGSAMVRLGSATGFSFLNLDEHGAQMQITAGTVGVHVRSMSDTLEVDTPNVAVALLGPGDYRIEVNDAGDATVVKVSGGTAEVSGGGQDFAVHPQQLATFAGSAEISERVASLGAPDAFDTWAYERDRQTQAAQAWSYVPAETVGAEDLDRNGTWQSTPDDGYVWAPNTVAVGWAPYRFGHWVWIAPWGWTWVDDAPWGFAPFHYGRWASFAGRWCWVPGPRRARPVYAPALVAWLGGVQLGGAAFAGGAVAWFPLGPREVYVPAYPASQTYIRNVNVTNTSVSGAYVTNVFNRTAPLVHYVNRNAPGAVTAIAQSAFASAMPVARNAVRMDANIVASAPVSATAPAVTPAKQSLLGAGASGPGIRHPPPAVQERVVLAKTLPPPPPVPFALQQQAIRANGGRPLARADLAALQILSGGAPVNRTASAPGAAAAGSGMARAAARSLAAPPDRQVAAMHSAKAPDSPVKQAVGPVPGTVPPEPQALQSELKLPTDRPASAIVQPPAPEPASPRVDRPSAAPQSEARPGRPPVQVKAPPPPPAASYPAGVAAPQVRAERAPAGEPRSSAPAEHAARPVGPLERNRGNN